MATVFVAFEAGVEVADGGGKAKHLLERPPDEVRGASLMAFFLPKGVEVTAGSKGEDDVVSWMSCINLAGGDVST